MELFRMHYNQYAYHCLYIYQYFIYLLDWMNRNQVLFIIINCWPWKRK